MSETEYKVGDKVVFQGNHYNWMWLEPLDQVYGIITEINQSGWIYCNLLYKHTDKPYAPYGGKIGSNRYWGFPKISFKGHYPLIDCNSFDINTLDEDQLIPEAVLEKMAV